MPTRKHHYLAACKLTFASPKGDPGVLEFNTVLIQDRKEVSSKSLGQIQTAAQLRFRQEITADPEYKVMDVFIVAISYLGHMSETEWKTTTKQDDGEPVSSEPVGHALLNPANPLDQSRGEQYVSATTGGDG